MLCRAEVRAMASDHANLLRRLRKQGFIVDKTGRHHKVRRGDGTGRFIVMPASPSDSYHGYRNRIRDLKSIGYVP